MSESTDQVQDLPAASPDMTDEIPMRVSEILRDALRSGVACAPVRALIGEGGIDAAYAAQLATTRSALAEGRRRVGHKIGLTSPKVQQQLGVDQPDFGVLFADMCVGEAESVGLDRLIAPRVEAEVAFVMDRDLPLHAVTAADVIRATAFVLPAIEIVDSRIRDWDITIVDTIADNASSGLFVLGTTPRRLVDLDVTGAVMTMWSGDTQVSSGTGAACLGSPINAVVWLANALSARGEAINAGDVVLSGALGPMVSVTVASSFRASIAGLGDVSVSFA